MPDLINPDLYTKAELRFAAWIVKMGGWCHEDTVMFGDGPDSRVANDWAFGSGRLRQAKKDGSAVVELTDAGWDWCRENGAV